MVQVSHTVRVQRLFEKSEHFSFPALINSEPLTAVRRVPSLEAYRICVGRTRADRGGHLDASVVSALLAEG